MPKTIGILGAVEAALLLRNLLLVTHSGRTRQKRLPFLTAPKRLHQCRQSLFVLIGSEERAAGF